jgi:hypothetical protein
MSRTEGMTGCAPNRGRLDKTRLVEIKGHFDEGNGRGKPISWTNTRLALEVHVKQSERKIGFA